MTIEPGGAEPAPLIVTAALDPASQACFERERTRHFPAALNIVPAHVTLFHHLPGVQQAAVERTLAELCATQPASLFTVSGVRFLGRGTAYVLELPLVSDLRRRLAQAWQPWMTAQDRQAWRPHVTVQNKVAAEPARQLYHELSRQFVPWTGQVMGLSLWRYRRTWDPLGTFPFAGMA